MIDDLLEANAIVIWLQDMEGDHQEGCDTAQTIQNFVMIFGLGDAGKTGGDRHNVLSTIASSRRDEPSRRHDLQIPSYNSR